MGEFAQRGRGYNHPEKLVTAIRNDPIRDHNGCERPEMLVRAE
jgi:hypothetical protein